jgi:hypothetical protein
MTLAVDNSTMTGSAFNWWRKGRPDDETRLLRVGIPELEMTMQLPVAAVLDQPMRVHDGEQTVCFTGLMAGMTPGYRQPVEYDGRYRDWGPHMERKSNAVVSGALCALTVVTLAMSVAWSGWGSPQTLLLIMALTIFIGSLAVSVRRKAGGWSWLRRMLTIFVMTFAVAALLVGAFMAVQGQVLVWLASHGVWV